MEYLLLSAIAGFLTILSPCVFTLLPVILSGSLADNNRSRAVVIIASLSVSVIIFTLVLKASTALIMVPQEFWSIVSGLLIFVFGIATVFPDLWGKVNLKLGLSNKSDSLLHASGKIPGWAGWVLLGFSLGPVFSSCSPTYTLILATILPQSFIVGLLNLLVYTAVMAFTLLSIALLGQGAVKRTRWLANPDGWFKKILGVVLIIFGLLVITGIDKDIQTWLLEQGFNPTNLELELLRR